MQLMKQPFLILKESLYSFEWGKEVVISKGSETNTCNVITRTLQIPIWAEFTFRYHSALSWAAAATDAVAGVTWWFFKILYFSIWALLSWEIQKRDHPCLANHPEASKNKPQAALVQAPHVMVARELLQPQCVIPPCVPSPMHYFPGRPQEGQHWGFVTDRMRMGNNLGIRRCYESRFCWTFPLFMAQRVQHALKNWFLWFFKCLWNLWADIFHAQALLEEGEILCLSGNLR